MAITITEDAQIAVNGLKYHLVSPLIETYLSPLPGKINVGSDSFAQENYLSNWIQSDRRGGILINDMDERIHANRVWWTNCILSHDKHLTLPRLVTALSALSVSPPLPTTVNFDFETDVSPASGFGWTENAGTWDRSTTQKKAGTYSWREPSAANGDNVSQDLSGFVPGVEYTFKAWAACEAANKTFKLTMGDQSSTTTGGTVTMVTPTVFYQATVTHTLAIEATRLRNTISSVVTDGQIFYIDEATITATDVTVGAFSGMVQFNGELYGAFGRCLAKVNAARDGWTLVAYLDDTIVRLVLSLNSTLAIFNGDSNNYLSMSTSELFTTSNSSAAFYGVLANGLLYKINSTGTFASSNDPESATPTWNNLADVTTDSDTIEGIIRGRDADGLFVVYCPTHSSLQVYDATNDLWLPTELRLPAHPSGGKGAIYWNDAHYFSYGLGIKKYVTGNPASISEIGLDRDGGLPVEYNGEITKFSADSQYFLAMAVDASKTSGNSQSGLYIWTGIAMECWWADPNNNAAMIDIVVSSAQSGYAIYFDEGGTVNYIDLPRGILNVRQLAGTQKFETSGIFLSPWFDAGTVAFDKLVQAITSYAKSVTANETITIKYRLDHDNEDRDTGFSTLVVLDTSGENGAVETLLASGAGLSFDAIQFRIDFARGGTNTDSPDLLALVTSYMLKTGAKGNWEGRFTVNIDGELDNQDIHQQYNSLWSATKSATLIPLVFRNKEVAETKYVRLFLAQGPTQTGSHYKGTMSFLAVEV